MLKLDNGMTWTQAEMKFQCRDCAGEAWKYDSQYTCNNHCVEGVTCSRECERCGKRVYFPGDLGPRPYNFICVYCGTNQSHGSAIDRNEIDVTGIDLWDLLAAFPPPLQSTFLRQEGDTVFLCRTDLYDRDFSEGAAQRVVDSLRS